MKGCGSFVFKAMQVLEKFNWKILVIFLENPGEKDYNEGSRLPGCGLPVRQIPEQPGIHGGIKLYLHGGIILISLAG